MTTESQVLQLLQQITLDPQGHGRIKCWRLTPCYNNKFELHINDDWYADGTLEFIESQVRDEYLPNSSTSKENTMKGYTKVWEGSGKESLIATKPWMSFIGTTAAEVTDTTNGDFALYVANEFIDWQHYRQTEEYICCWGQSQSNPMRGY